MALTKLFIYALKDIYFKTITTNCKYLTKPFYENFSTSFSISLHFSKLRIPFSLSYFFKQINLRNENVIKINIHHQFHKKIIAELFSTLHFLTPVFNVQKINKQYSHKMKDFWHNFQIIYSSFPFLILDFAFSRKCIESKYIFNMFFNYLFSIQYEIPQERTKRHQQSYGLN